MTLREIGALGDTKCQNLNSFKHFETGKFLANPSDLMSRFIFSELKGFSAKPFSKRLMSILSIYLHHLEECMRQIKPLI